MKVLLRDTQTGLYYQGSSGWTPELDDALDVRQLPRAIALAFEADLKNVEVLLCYEDPHYNLVLPIARPPSPD